jgi:hypothetical protein
MSSAAGVVGAELGMHRAADHAEAEAPGWSDRALDYVHRYLREHPGKPVIAAEVRTLVHAQGLDLPPSPYAWGAVMRAAARRGWIKRDGFTNYGDATTHTQPVTVWKSLVEGTGAPASAL